MSGNQYTEEFWDRLDDIVKKSEVVIDRPKGSHHPKYPAIVYLVDYGYLAATASMDGNGIDVWQGTGLSQGICGIIVTVDTMKNDSEIKILLNCTAEEMETVYNFHNEGEYMRGILITRP